MLVDVLENPGLKENGFNKMIGSSTILHLKEEIKKKEDIIAQLTHEMADFKKEYLLAQNRYSEKDDRIEELEEALRESVRITAEREVALDGETAIRIKSEEEVEPVHNFVTFFKRYRFYHLFFLVFPYYFWFMQNTILRILS